MPAPSAPRPSAVLASADSAPKLMSDTKTGICRRNGFAAAGPIVTDVSTGSSSSIGKRCSCAVSTCRSSHVGSSGPGHPHGGDLAVRAGEPVARERVDLRDERLLDGVLVRVVEQPVVGRGHGPLRTHVPVLDQVGLIDQHLGVGHVAGELVDPLGRVVGRHTGVEPVVPAVHTADQVRAFHPAVGEQRPAVRAAALEDVHLLPAAHQHQVDAVGRGVCRNVLHQLVQAGDRQIGAAVHVTLPAPSDT